MTLFIGRRELLERFRAGERRALEEAYRHYAPVVGTFLSRGFTFSSREKVLRFPGYRSPFDLDNALAETFVRAFGERARQSYDGINPYKSYLLTIARNLVIDELRANQVVASEALEDVELRDRIDASTDLGEPPSAEESLLAKELEDLCRQFVGRLSERDRIFFHARFEEAKTQVGAGRDAGLSHMQARTLEKRLRQRLLAFLHAGGYLETTDRRRELAR
jgi:RNA polymerase sigma factor (sigma-70 family)